MRQAFILTREHTHEALLKIEAVQRTWESLFGEPGDRGHYGRYQLRLGYRAWHASTSKISRFVIDGREFHGHLRLVTAKAWFAKKLYELAVARTRERYPRWDEHAYSDGTRIGERVLEFQSEEHELGWAHLWNSLYHLDRPRVTEELFDEPCSNWGYPLPLAQTLRYGGDMSKGYRLVTVILGKDEISEEDWNRTRIALESGERLALSDKPIEFAFDDVRESLVQLSSPELAVLNWADACPPLTEPDKEYLAAIEDADPERAYAAIARGANPNAIEPGKNYPIDRFIESWCDQRYEADKTPDKAARPGARSPESVLTREQAASAITRLVELGAHPDIFPPDESPAIVDASIGSQYDLVKALLEAGAQASTDWAWDGSLGEWPQAWESPYFDAFHEGDAAAKEVYCLLMLSRPSPIYDVALERADIVEARKTLSDRLSGIRVRAEARGED